jgi:hypothetical protein
MAGDAPGLTRNTEARPSWRQPHLHGGERGTKASEVYVMLVAIAGTDSPLTCTNVVGAKGLEPLTSAV